MSDTRTIYSGNPLKLAAGATDFLTIPAPQNNKPFFWGFDIPSNKKVFFLGQDLSGTQVLKLKFYNSEAAGDVEISGYIIQ
ncbi:hypothetical protein C6W24_00315 [Bacillus atrophaeus]|uniref:hypothetical protein n=1 Tax=Bacillus atrophaeus TaxID=1452 RepID=UPI000D02C8F9|nr:hypothetical protein [Bacillus atrophaeus]PRS02455.1 hypothetical protein C6W24_00315 [Bacillus atrophaeus]